MKLEANCKINVGLRVLHRRDDGFHDLETVMVPVRGLYDEIVLERTCESGFSLQQSGIAVDCATDDNLCIKACRLMQRLYGVDGVALTLDKRVPFGAGLGGGSSDATAVLVGLNKLFALGLSEKELTDLAATLGSDTAFFVKNTPSLCTGRGEIMHPIDIALANKWLVVIKPDVAISTREAYAGVVPAIPAISLADALARPVAEWRKSVVNDFEKHLFAAHPLLTNLKQRLYDAGALYASMSGSGSALFGIFQEKPDSGNLPQGLFVHTERIENF